MRRALIACCLLVAALGGGAQGAGKDGVVRLKELGRVDGWRDNSLMGYGLVTGLAGTGDSARNRATRQSIANLMSQFGVVLPSEQVASRNVAAVMVMATLPPFATPGGKLDVTVNSVGDARSLLGGTLLLAPLKGADGRVHALAQGPVSVGGYKYDSNFNLVQKNHPTVGAIPDGATVELGVRTRDIDETGRTLFVLSNPDYTTATRVAESINREFGAGIARSLDPSTVEIQVPQADRDSGTVAFMMRVENLAIEPDQRARVIINERTGMVISGGDVRISQVTISHGELKISVTNDYLQLQPRLPVLEGRVRAPMEGSSRMPPMMADRGVYGPITVVPQSSLGVNEGEARSVTLAGNSTVADLVRALGRIQTSPREMISILQGMKAAGALYAELIIQ